MRRVWRAAGMGLSCPQSSACGHAPWGVKFREEVAAATPKTVHAAASSSDDKKSAGDEAPGSPEEMKRR
jgi:hypothetical protein